MLFNIGALYSQLAAKVDRGSVEGRAEAVDLLEKAVGMFEYVRDKFSNAPSRDLSPDMLSMLADLMRVCVCVWAGEMCVHQSVTYTGTGSGASVGEQSSVS